jgi:hypothetical protein
MADSSRRRPVDGISFFKGNRFQGSWVLRFSFREILLAPEGGLGPEPRACIPGQREESNKNRWLASKSVA